MSTRTPNLVTVEKDGQVWQLHDSVHVAAFLAEGWKIAEPAEPVKRTRKAKAKE
jgi:hypothetical protein